MKRQDEQSLRVLSKKSERLDEEIRKGREECWRIIQETIQKHPEYVEYLKFMRPPARRGPIPLRISPADWERLKNDYRTPLMKFLRTINNYYKKELVKTGNTDAALEKTRRWLQNNKVLLAGKRKGCWDIISQSLRTEIRFPAAKVATEILTSSLCPLCRDKLQRKAKGCQPGSCWFHKSLRARLLNRKP